MSAPIKLNFLFCKRRMPFDALSNVNQTEVSSVDILVITAIAQNRVNSVG